MPNLNIVVLGPKGYAKNIGKSGTESDITFINLKKEEDTVTIIEPTRYPDRLAPLYYAVAMSDSALLVIDEITPVLGEMVIMLDVMGIRSGVIVLQNYLDKSQIAPLVRGTVLEGYEFVEDNPIELRERFLSMAAETTYPDPIPGTGFVMIDHAFNVKGIGTVVLGSVEKGTIHQHDTVTVLPGNMTCQIRSIQKHDEDAKEAYQTDRVGLALKNISAEELERGMVMTTDSSIQVTSEISGTAQLVRFWPEPLREGLVVHIGLWTQFVTGRVTSVKNDSDWHSCSVVIELDKDIAYLPGEKAVIHYLDGGKLRIAGSVMLN
ncbi:EF-Tu/IF-2/RF-3 family GTPase [Methanogenium organophilum]|uniref:EF-Tu/IF-2/RF-3 family GTPase n=1 Tax=Methanogenium organophilum TaxID=2199 RepID=A0A9X9S3S9_METOG|nr:EF-Tu/IF-2/RF-3 family GTPase [Methanogenium organophilum]WAI01263.1 EF-Tu/IF-2/RF-3 family GTPase [Methanogenium organophilum]